MFLLPIELPIELPIVLPIELPIGIGSLAPVIPLGITRAYWAREPRGQGASRVRARPKLRQQPGPGPDRLGGNRGGAG